MELCNRVWRNAVLVKQICFLKSLRLLADKCPVCHSRMSLMILYTYIVPCSLESTFKFIISFNVNESIAEEVILPLSDEEGKCWLRKTK